MGSSFINGRMGNGPPAIKLYETKKLRSQLPKSKNFRSLQPHNLKIYLREKYKLTNNNQDLRKRNSTGLIHMRTQILPVFTTLNVLYLIYRILLTFLDSFSVLGFPYLRIRQKSHRVSKVLCPYKYRERVRILCIYVFFRQRHLLCTCVGVFCIKDPEGKRLTIR